MAEPGVLTVVPPGRLDPDRAVARLQDSPLTLARTRRLGRRVLAVESDPAGAANTGIVVGDERVLVFDTRVTPTLGAELAHVVLAATGARPADLIVVNSHFHGDHVFGNGAFRGATILATTSTRAAELREWQRQVAIFERLRPQDAADVRNAAVAPPTIGIGGPARIDLGGVEVELEPFGPAHTEGDLVAHVPDEGVAFVGDLVFNGHWPSMWDADVRGWLAALRRLGGSAAATLVPGHGPTGGQAMVARMADCLRFLVALEHAGGDQAAEVAASPFADLLHPDRVDEGRLRVREQAVPAEASMPPAGFDHQQKERA
ncbi:MBL fold metallo-hydrolase [Pseudonocardia sulfidoxydans NBRC 16205]|uniref:MBL fold metallo-hydrolase n=1 Tax=Pseudonocardia sulfidoxydans NBRC 16205 TaxID=1223511 RepID=A0A511DQG1_9PSEU|nr:MBL fold metallo-hydrolase [Pseudonocardia sulfidoxydans]GEL27065.1 MBL fold metallo-hydrolase [Pseudonocardia sulfidoxydans NBRC 16205]